MADIAGLYERLARAVMLESEDAAIRFRAEFEPQAGPGTKVFPPTYLERDNSRYHFERRWREDGTVAEVVMLDSYQSQANRCEAALARVASQIGLPQLVMRCVVDGKGKTVEISSLEAPHRSRDAYFLDSTIDRKPFDQTTVGSALRAATLKDLTAFLQYAPTDLVYGVWDSHRGDRIPLKFARAYTSEMVGWEPERGKRAMSKGDPFNLPGGDVVDPKEWRPQWSPSNKKEGKKKKPPTLSTLGHGRQIELPQEQGGGVSVRRISRLGVLSLVGLARHQFGGDEAKTRAGRAALAALGLLGDRLAFASPGIHLRSGADLVLKQDAMEWVCRGDRTEPLDLTPDEALKLVNHARERLAAAGVQWSAEPVVMEPSPKLAETIAAVLKAGSIGDTED